MIDLNQRTQEKKNFSNRLTVVYLFFGLLLIYPFIMISFSAIIYLLLMPISFFHYHKLKKQNHNKNHTEEDDFEDVL